MRVARGVRKTVLTTKSVRHDEGFFVLKPRPSSFSILVEEVEVACSTFFIVVSVVGVEVEVEVSIGAGIVIAGSLGSIGIVASSSMLLLITEFIGGDDVEGSALSCYGNTVS